MIVVGIDPGVSGAVAAVDSRGTCCIEDMPTVSNEGNGRTVRKLAGYQLGQIVRRLVPPGEPCIVVLEDVHVMPSSKSGGAANTSLLHSKGVIEGVLDMLRLQPVLVAPATWKRHFGLIAERDTKDAARKAAALDCARRLYPACNALARAKDHNRAESLLMAHYGLQVFA